MDDFDARQLAAVHAETQENGYQFLQTELVTCFNALEFGHFEFDRGANNDGGSQA